MHNNHSRRDRPSTGLRYGASFASLINPSVMTGCPYSGNKISIRSKRSAREMRGLKPIKVLGSRSKGYSRANGPRVSDKARPNEGSAVPRVVLRLKFGGPQGLNGRSGAPSGRTLSGRGFSQPDVAGSERPRSRPKDVRATSLQLQNFHTL